MVAALEVWTIATLAVSLGGMHKLLTALLLAKTLFTPVVPGTLEAASIVSSTLEALMVPIAPVASTNPRRLRQALIGLARPLFGRA